MLRKAVVSIVALFLSFFVLSLNVLATETINKTIVIYEFPIITKDAVYLSSKAAREDLSYSLDEKMKMPKASWNWDSIIDGNTNDAKYRMRSLIDALAEDHFSEKQNASSFFQYSYGYYIVEVIEEASVQCIVSSPENWGFVLTPVKLVSGFYYKNDATLEKAWQIGAKVYLAETYYIDSTDSPTLCASCGGNQKPLRSRHKYLIKAQHLLCFADDPDDVSQVLFGYKNAQPLYLDSFIFFFDEVNCFDANDLKYDANHIEKLTASGLYMDYEDVQYSGVKAMLGRYNELLKSSKLSDFALSKQKEKIKQSLPYVSIGVAAGALCCLVPVICVAAVKKKKAKKKPLESAPQDLN